MISEARREFFIAIGNVYEKFGYPSLGGWIEALLLLESEIWTQETISRRLSALFPDADHPTSRASVNRVLKLLENYGTVMKTGSRKLGYSYRLAPSSNIILNMFHQFISINKLFMQELTIFKEKSKINDDLALNNAIDMQIEGIKTFNQVIETAIRSISKIRNE